MDSVEFLVPLRLTGRITLCSTCTFDVGIPCVYRFAWSDIEANACNLIHRKISLHDYTSRNRFALTCFIINQKRFTVGRVVKKYTTSRVMPVLICVQFIVTPLRVFVRHRIDCVQQVLFLRNVLMNVR